MLRRCRKCHLVVTEKILPVISYFFIVLSIGIEAAARKSMGIHRDLVFRKGALEDTVLSVKLLNIYKWIIIAGIVVCIGIIILRRANIIGRLKQYVFFTVALSIVLLVMIIFYKEVSLIAYPWMVVSVGTAVIFQYIRIINLTVDYYR
ncbi:hypothetical protein R9X47_20935 [Wukongibacter baidiensis]|uniref:hypothetical protein n=1 Tax=Wukongibacter baidiensis TaxID=1723361 RepID=UPI003D7FEA85